MCPLPSLRKEIQWCTQSQMLATLTDAMPAKFSPKQRAPATQVHGGQAQPQHMHADLYRM